MKRKSFLVHALALAATLFVGAVSAQAVKLTLAHGTALDNPSFAEVAHAMGLRSRRVEDPAELESVLREAVSSNEPWLVDVVTNPDEVSVPGKVHPGQALGFAKAKVTEAFSKLGTQSGDPDEG